jgi:hypothetical protein
VIKRKYKYNINNISISRHDKTKVQNFPITLNISYYNNHTYLKGWVIIKTKGPDVRECTQCSP